MISDCFWTILPPYLHPAHFLACPHPHPTIHIELSGLKLVQSINQSSCRVIVESNQNLIHLSNRNNNMRSCDLILTGNTVILQSHWLYIWTQRNKHRHSRTHIQTSNAHPIVDSRHFIQCQFILSSFIWSTWTIPVVLMGTFYQAISISLKLDGHLLDRCI